MFKYLFIGGGLPDTDKYNKSQWLTNCNDPDKFKEDIKKHYKIELDKK